MALKVGELAAVLDLDTKGFDDGMDKADKRVGGLGKGMGGLAGMAATAVAGVGLGAAVIGNQWANMASTLEEARNKTNVVFKGSAGSIHDWAKGAATDFGQSTRQAEQAAGTFGNMFTQLGIGLGPAADMSMQMTELASDFASFHDADPSEVINAQTAAFRGEYDALQRFVPTINAASVEQEALRMTGKATTGELTAQEKALATHKLMMEGAGEATGDFDRTSGSLANAQRTLSGEWENARTKLGEQLLPVITEATLWLAEKMPQAVVWVQEKWEKWGPTITKVAGFIWDVAKVMGAWNAKVVETWATILGGGAHVLEWFNALPGKMTKATSGLWNGLTDGFKSAINWIIRKWNDLSFGMPDFEVFGKKVEGFSVDTPNIPYMAAGGHVMGSGLAVVGEAGPELVSLGRGASVTPLAPSDRMSTGTTVTIEKIEINGVRDGADVVRVLPDLRQALAAGVGRNG